MFGLGKRERREGAGRKGIGGEVEGGLGWVGKAGRRESYAERGLYGEAEL